MQPRPQIIELDDYECLMVEMAGKKKGRKRTIQVCCMARSIPEWNIAAGDADTGMPPSIVAQMMASGLIGERGAFPPEFHVPIQPFFEELKKRRMKVFIR
jgi:saccharopine dehydrogenase-like NADP-dependent oxidoreductase